MTDQERLNVIDNIDKFNESLKLNLYYIIVAVVSVLAMVFLPMIGSSIGIDWNLPTTIAGWIVFITSRVIVAGLNITIFHAFVQQAKINIRNNENYKKANEICGKIESKEKRVPLSPKEFTTGIYLKKGATIFIMTFLALFAFSQAIFTYNWQDLLTYGFCIVLGVIFGLMTMMNVEIYWTTDYLLWAESIKEEQNGTKDCKKLTATSPKEHN